jgi:hypothetical protein
MDSITALEINPTAIGAGGLGWEFFSEGDLKDIEHRLGKGFFHSPLGTEKARVLGLYENRFLLSCSAFRTEKLSKLGGWDESDKSMWEDWALWLRLSWLGESLVLIGAVTFAYRQRPDSMSKTYDMTLSTRRILRSAQVLKPYEVNMIRTYGRQGSADQELGLFVITNLLKSRRFSWIPRFVASVRRKIPNALAARLQRFL